VRARSVQMFKGQGAMLKVLPWLQPASVPVIPLYPSRLKQTASLILSKYTFKLINVFFLSFTDFFGNVLHVV
jgi:hypothetical protein